MTLKFIERCWIMLKPMIRELSSSTINFIALPGVTCGIVPEILGWITCIKLAHWLRPANFCDVRKWEAKCQAIKEGGQWMTAKRFQDDFIGSGVCDFFLGALFVRMCVHKSYRKRMKKGGCRTAMERSALWTYSWFWCKNKHRFGLCFTLVIVHFFND